MVLHNTFQMLLVRLHVEDNYFINHKHLVDVYTGTSHIRTILLMECPD